MKPYVVAKEKGSLIPGRLIIYMYTEQTLSVNIPRMSKLCSILSSSICMHAFLIPSLTKMDLRLSSCKELIDLSYIHYLRTKGSGSSGSIHTNLQCGED